MVITCSITWKIPLLTFEINLVVSPTWGKRHGGLVSDPPSDGTYKKYSSYSSRVSWVFKGLLKLDRWGRRWCKLYLAYPGWALGVGNWNQGAAVQERHLEIRCNRKVFRSAFFYLNHQGWERRRGQALLAARRPKVWEVPQEVPC